MTTSHASASAALAASRAPRRSADEPTACLVDVPDERDDVVRDERATTRAPFMPHPITAYDVASERQSVVRGQDAGRGGT